VLAVFAAYAIPVCYGMLKFRRLTSYHTTAARVSGVLVVAAAALVFIAHLTWPLYVAAAVLVVSALEEVAITYALDAWRAEVPSLFALPQPFRSIRCRNVSVAKPAASASLSARSR
jgi:CDP-diacylglycerol--glycerol-3-phosphate 3-phosphatidyltransferase